MLAGISMAYLDIYHLARTNLDFRETIGRLADQLAQLENVPDNQQNRQLKVACMKDVYRKCDFNPGFLVPHFFPRYPSTKPLSLSTRPFSYALYSMIIGGSMTVRGSRQITKCRAVRGNEPVWASNGQPLLPKDLKPGVRVLSVDSQCRRTTSVVKAVHRAGILPVYKVTLRSGRSLLLSGNHGLRTLAGWEEVRNFSKGDRIATMRLGGFFGQKEVEKARIVLTAYMLGDGSCVAGNFNFTSACQAALSEFKELAAPLQVKALRVYSKKEGKASSVNLSYDTNSSKLRAWLQEDGIWNSRAWEKKLPAWVFDLSDADTALFLSRLWATDGCVKQYSDVLPQIKYSSASELLAVGVQSLLCKFGIESTVTSGMGRVNGVDTRPCYTVRVKGRRSWLLFKKIFSNIPGKPSDCIRVNGNVASNNNDDVLPKEIFNLLGVLGAACARTPHGAFKKNGLTLQRSYCPGVEKLRRYLEHGRCHVPDHPCLDELEHWLDTADVTWSLIKSVTYEGQEECWDIEVEDTHNYVLDGVVSHNSTCLAGRTILNCSILPKWSTLYICPHSEHRSTFANKLREMETGFRGYVRRSDLRQNLYLKEWPNGSSSELHRAWASAAHLRGKSANEIDYDEYQLFDPSLEEEIKHVQTAFELKTTVYTGTSTTVDSPLEDRYQSASQGTWHVKSGGRWLDFGDQDTIMKMIRPKGVCDPVTGNLIDVSQGQFIHRYAERLERNLVSLHVPKIIIPEFVTKPVHWLPIYEGFKNGDLAIWLQEVMGIPVEEGSREITRKDLEGMCLLGSKNDLLAKAQAGYYKHVVSGFDWGGADHQQASNVKTSYTTHAILGVTYSGKVEILHLKKHPGMGYRQIVDAIIKDHLLYKGGAIASDFGGGQIYNQIVREYEGINPERHFVLDYVGPNCAPFAAPKGEQPMYNQWAVNRTESLTRLFESIKDPDKILTCYAWDQSKNLLEDFMNATRVMSENLVGVRRFRYIRQPSKSDDVMHAVNFAYIMCRILLGQPIVRDPGTARLVGSRLRSNVSYNPLAGGGFIEHSGRMLVLN